MSRMRKVGEDRIQSEAWLKTMDDTTKLWKKIGKDDELKDAVITRLEEDLKRIRQERLHDKKYYEAEINRTADLHKQHLEDQQQKLNARTYILVAAGVFAGIVLLSTIGLLFGAAAGWLTVSPAVQGILATSIIAEIIAIYKFLVKYYHPSTTTTQQTRQDPEQPNNQPPVDPEEEE